MGHIGLIDRYIHNYSETAVNSFQKSLTEDNYLSKRA